MTAKPLPFSIRKPRKSGKARKRNKSEETQIQIDIIKAIESILPEHALVWHTPNGGDRHFLEAIKFKHMGVLAGVLDLAIVLDGKVYFIEVKKNSKEPLRESQEKFIKKLIPNKIDHCVVWSVEQAVEFVNNVILNRQA